MTRGGNLALTSKQVQKNGQVGIPIEDRRALGLEVGETVYVGVRDDVLPGVVLVIPAALLEQIITDGLQRQRSTKTTKPKKSRRRRE